MNRSFKLFQAVAIACLSGTLLLAACGEKPTTTTSTTVAPIDANAPNAGKIAFVNLDTLENKYEYFKAKKVEFEKRQKGMQDEVERLARNFQNEVAAFQKKAQAGTLTQAEGEAAQKRLASMQGNLEQRQQSLSEQLMKEQETFNMELQKRLDAFLITYNKEKGYDYILSYIKGGNILYANSALDITDDVIRGMNEGDKKGANQPATADSAK